MLQVNQAAVEPALRPHRVARRMWRNQREDHGFQSGVFFSLR
jgi:hypothetical protein